jgi:hypothetical protein
MIIGRDRILLGVTEEQLKKVILPALRTWEGPYSVTPSTPAEIAHEAKMLRRAKELMDEIITFFGN